MVLLKQVFLLQGQIVNEFSVLRVTQLLIGACVGLKIYTELEEGLNSDDDLRLSDLS